MMRIRIVICAAIASVGVFFAASPCQAGAPTADAGGPYAINEGQNLILDASGSSDPDHDILLYLWDLDGNGIDDAQGVNPTVPWSVLEALGLSSSGFPLLIELRVVDSHGTPDTDMTTLTINNMDPIADADGPYMINEGEDLVLDASGSWDPGGDPLAFAWDLDNDGAFDDAVGINPTVPWAALMPMWLPSDGTALFIAVRVDDIDGGSSTAMTTLTINNMDPIADADGPYMINEGEDLVLDASGSWDPGGDPLAFAWDLDNDGAFDDAAGIDPSVSWSTLQAFGLPSDGMPLVVELRVDDIDGGSTMITAILTIINVAPVVDSGGPYAINNGDDLSLNATAFDLDDNDLLMFRWDLDYDGMFDDASGPNSVVSWAVLETLGLPADGTLQDIAVEVADDVAISVVTTTLTINPATTNRADVNDDGAVDMLDLSELAKNWLWRRPDPCEP